MKEDFIQYIWKFKLFNTLNLKTVSGKKIEIIHQGFQNFTSGPDFINAKIKIDNQLWAGNIEIHIEQNNWNLHKHQLDESYNNVILHVAYSYSDLILKTKNGRVLETIFIKDLIYKETEKNYQTLMKGKRTFIACENLLKHKKIIFFSIYDRLLSERLERKSQEIEQDIKLSIGDLDKAFLITLFKYFGAPQNKVSFEILARNIDLKHIIKQAVSIKSLEALLFGVAGFLDNDVESEYKDKLENEFAYQKQLYKLESPLRQSQWKFAGVRPPSFPTVRIAQLAALLFKEQRWFSFIQNEGDIQIVRKKLKIVASSYWKTHYNFGVSSKKLDKELTESFIDKIIINVFVPFLFYYGKHLQEEKYIVQAFDLLSTLKPEKNKITNEWKNLGLSNKNAFESQALIELKQNYCNEKKCLECNIGYTILKKE